jgi:hypothetical protein
MCVTTEFQKQETTSVFSINYRQRGSKKRKHALVVFSQDLQPHIGHHQATYLRVERLQAAQLFGVDAIFRAASRFRIAKESGSSNELDGNAFQDAWYTRVPSLIKGNTCYRSQKVNAVRFYAELNYLAWN